MSIEGSVLISG